MSIVVDVRVQKEAQAIVRAKFVNTVDLRVAVALLADMAGLRCVEKGNILYVTSVANARRLQREIKHERGSESGPRK